MKKLFVTTYLKTMIDRNKQRFCNSDTNPTTPYLFFPDSNLVLLGKYLDNGMPFFCKKKNTMKTLFVTTTDLYDDKKTQRFCNSDSSLSQLKC